jgi:hypothetical protein
MDLNENIYRIQELMLVEDKKTIQVTNMVKDLGLYQTIKFLGGYDRVERLVGDYKISKTEKINAIIERVTDIHQSIGDNDSVEVWITDIGLEPIEYNGLNNAGTRYDYQLIEVLYRDGVIVFGYRDKYSGQDMGSFERDYEDLSDEEIEDILKTIMN